MVRKGRSFGEKVKRGPKAKSGIDMRKELVQRALSKDERERVVTVATSEEYVNKSPAAIVASQLDTGVFLCSERTIYRLLPTDEMVHERRSVAMHPVYSKPELMATGPRAV